MKYGGHSNKETVKDVSFVGPNDEVIAAGSDNGCMYLWDRRSGARHFHCLSSVISMFGLDRASCCGKNLPSCFQQLWQICVEAKG